MKPIFHIYIILFSCLLSMSCKEVCYGEVKYTGALKTMMSGNLDATVSLDTLSHKPHLYALGAIENLKGEIQIFDGSSFNSSVNRDRDIEIDNSYSSKAALLVYAQVDDWWSITIPKEIKTMEMLESFILKRAQFLLISDDKPFPFLIEGLVGKLDWHITNWKDGDTVHTHQKHKESGLNGTLKEESVSIVGFYSSKHKAVFTHHTTNMHMHFKTQNLAGHIDNLQLKEGMQLKLQKR